MICKREDRGNRFQISRPCSSGRGTGGQACALFTMEERASKQRKWEKVGHSMGDLIIKALRLRKKERIIELMLEVGARGYQATEL